jgi:hypothetical protein
MSKQIEARAFAIWRYANARDWDVSYDEISDATGLKRSQIDSTIKEKGWAGKIGRGRGGRGTSAGAAKASRTKGYRFDENALDLCQIIGEEL